MRSLLNKLSLAWLVLALIVSPLQAATSPFLGSSTGDCPLHAGQAGATGMHHQLAQDHGDHASLQCPQCADHGCNDGKCDDAGCCSLHIPLSVTGTTLVIGVPPVLAVYPERAEKSDSLPPSPLYRPPV
jgi:hypothetical protein